MIMRNTIPNRIDVVIYLKSIFFLEKFVNTDIEFSENKKQSGILDKAVQRLFMSDCPEYFRQLKHKREAKRSFDNSRKIWENPYH